MTKRCNHENQQPRFFQVGLIHFNRLCRRPDLSCDRRIRGGAIGKFSTRPEQHVGCCLPGGPVQQRSGGPDSEVARLDLPTGGRYEFDWENGPGVFPYDTCPSNDSPNQQCPAVRAPSGVQASLGLPPGYDLLIAVYRRVKERREYVDSGLSWTRRTTYSVSESSASVSGDPAAFYAQITALLGA